MSAGSGNLGDVCYTHWEIQIASWDQSIQSLRYNNWQLCRHVWLAGKLFTEKQTSADWEVMGVRTITDVYLSVSLFP